MHEREGCKEDTTLWHLFLTKCEDDSIYSLYHLCSVKDIIKGSKIIGWTMKETDKYLRTPNTSLVVTNFWKKKVFSPLV